MFFGARTAFAQGSFETIKNSPAVVSITTKILNVIVIPLLEGFFILTALIFIWGVFGLIRSGDDPTARKEGQNHILWGVIGMFIMISAYGIIRVIGNTVGVGDPFNF